MAKVPPVMSGDSQGWMWGLLALATLLLAVYLLSRMARARLTGRLQEELRARPHLLAKPTRYPIVLAHGWLGFDAIALPGARHEYFRGVRARLEEGGHRVFTIRVSPLAGIQRRAKQFAQQVQEIGADKVNIIAHSMGGLDARYAISHLGIADQVASLVTIGTPHHGTPVADRRFLKYLLPLQHMAAQFGTDLEGLYDISTSRMSEFNQEVPDKPGIWYASYIAWVRKGQGRVHRLLAPSHAYLERRAAENDGLVPASSQRWGEVLGEVHADHWAQIGWSGGFDAGGFYADVARLLADRGF